MSHLPSEFKHLEGKVLSSRVYPEFFSLGGEEKVLNVGCGEGPQMVVYAGRFKSMLGVDIMPDRLAGFRKLGDSLHQNVETLESNVESIGLPDGSFDVVMAIDIIEHVEHPEKLLSEINRLLRPGGRLLITFPAMHDKFVDGLSALKVFFTRQKKTQREGWHPDDHQHEYPVGKWVGMVEAAGLRSKRSRATTMFPPLHLYGVPRFWFSCGILHAIDKAVCSIPGINRLGQTVMAEFVKPV